MFTFWSFSLFLTTFHFCSVWFLIVWFYQKAISLDGDHDNCIKNKALDRLSFHLPKRLLTWRFDKDRFSIWFVWFWFRKRIMWMTQRYQITSSGMWPSTKWHNKRSLSAVWLTSFSSRWPARQSSPLRSLLPGLSDRRWRERRDAGCSRCRWMGLEHFQTSGCCSSVMGRPCWPNVEIQS